MEKRGKRDWRFALIHGVAAVQQKPVCILSHYEEKDSSYYAVRTLSEGDNKWEWEKKATDGYIWSSINVANPNEKLIDSQKAEES